MRADRVEISSDVSGRVARVLVANNQQVQAGQLLLEIDPEPFRLALDQAQSRLRLERQEIAALRAQHKQKAAMLQLAKGNLDFFRRQFRRQNALAVKRVISGARLDRAIKDLRNAEDEVRLMRQGLSETAAKLGGRPQRPVDLHPAVRFAMAVRDEAALNLRRTRLRAPSAGRIANFEVQKGEYVGRGAHIFSLIGDGRMWIVANYRETNVTNVRVGQAARVIISAYPGIQHDAVVVSLSPTTTAEFARVPVRHSAGNWVKVVQRLSVRLNFKDGAAIQALRSGMSVRVEIDTGYRRELSGLGPGIAYWLGL